MKGGGSVNTPSPEEYMPLIQQQADINRIDQVTPFGGTRYVKPDIGDPLSYGEWMDESGYAASTPIKQARPLPYGRGYTDRIGGGPDIVTPDYGGLYNDYLDSHGSDLQPTVEAYFSPEFQSMFDKQFDPNAYDNYGDEYFANAKRFLDPIYENQTERFEQSMANRGQPVGGELYDDSFGNLMDAQNKGWENAAFGAQKAGDMARLEDYNRLMTAMGMNTIATPQIDAMGPANMAFNANASNAAIDSQGNSDMWNTAATVAAAYFMSAKELKEDFEETNTLDKLISIPVETWRYKGEEDRHINTYAKDFQETFGVGDGQKIMIMDAIGVLMRSVQELAIEVRAMK